MKRKLSMEQRDQISRLYQQKLTPVEVAKITGLPYNTVSYYEPNVRPRIMESQRNYAKKPSVIQKKREYSRRSDVIERTRERIRRKKSILDISPNISYTFEELRKECGGMPKNLREELDLDLASGVVEKIEKNGVKKYKLNTKSPFRKIFGHNFGDSENEFDTSVELKKRGLIE